MYNNCMEKEVKTMIEDINGFRLPRYTQIPDVGLYLEQVVRYVNAHLAPLGEPELTSSMVSNYVKQGLIPSPVKKSYAAEHLARLLPFGRTHISELLHLVDYFRCSPVPE